MWRHAATSSQMLHCSAGSKLSTFIAPRIWANSALSSKPSHSRVLPWQQRGMDSATIVSLLTLSGILGYHVTIPCARRSCPSPPAPAYLREVVVISRACEVQPPQILRWQAHQHAVEDVVVPLPVLLVDKTRLLQQILLDLGSLNHSS